MKTNEQQKPIIAPETLRKLDAQMKAHSQAMDKWESNFRKEMKSWGKTKRIS